MRHRLDRRTFLFGSLSVGAVGTTGISRGRAQDERLRIGIIGVGGQGAYSWKSLAGEEIVALCDVDLGRVTDAAKQFPHAEVVPDFRRLLDRKDIDAVAVCTPDHWHAIPTVWAMETGKHVYCEKPLGHSLWETRVMAEKAKSLGRITQMGTQIHAGRNYRRVVELIRGGVIGTVRRVDVWCEKRPDPGRLAAVGEPPAGLNYDMWLGPAPERPFSSEVVPFHWRWWWEFGGGVLADMACHFMDLPHWALGLHAPDRIAARGTLFPDADNKVPVTMRVDYRYPRSESGGEVDLTWYHGTPGPVDEEGRVLETGYRNGVLFHGTSGRLIADYSRHTLLPEELFRDAKLPDRSIPDSPGHHQEWLAGIRSGTPPMCGFHYAGPLTEAVLLGNVAFRLRREIHWDSEKLRITNAPEREWRPLLRREYRGAWRLGRGL